MRSLLTPSVAKLIECVSIGWLLVFVEPMVKPVIWRAITDDVGQMIFDEVKLQYIRSYMCSPINTLTDLDDHAYAGRSV